MRNENFVSKAMSLLTMPEEKIVVPAPFEKQEMTTGDSLVLDFLNHQVGYLELNLNYTGSHPDAPVLLRIHFAENKVELEEKQDEYHGWLCPSWIEEERIHVDILPCTLNLPRRYAFRYVKIEVLAIGSKFKMVVEDAKATAVSAVINEAPKVYETADARKAQLDAIACRTLQNCMQQVFEDGPKRDRRLWLGDLRLQALANYETYEKNDMVKACLYLFAGMPMEDGRMGACLFLEPKPEVDDTVMFDYSLFFVNALYDYFENTKDKTTLVELWPTAYKQILLATEKLDNNHLVEDSDVLGWCFIDWNLNLNKQAGAQGIFLYALSAAIKIAAELEDVMAEEKLAELYCECREAANRFLWDNTKKCYVSGKNAQVSIASQVWMILGEAIDGENARQLLAHVLAMPEAEQMVTPYMYHNLIDAFMHVNQKDKAMEYLLSYWGQMADAGADTFWELFNPKNPNESPYGGTIVNSYCHAWSCAPAYFLRKYDL